MNRFHKYICITTLTVSLVLSQTSYVKAQTQLVDIKQYSPQIALDIRYASTNNFIGRAMYSSARCLLRPQVAVALAQVERRLNSKGIGLKLWDCYRPLSVQREMYRVVNNPRYVGDPAKGPKHTRGGAVDLTLINLSTGREYPMPSEYDDFSPKAARGYRGVSQTRQTNSKVLEHYMLEGGFVPYQGEWWHYDAPNWRSYRPLDISL